MAEPQTLFPILYHLESSSSLRVLFALEELAAARGIKYEFKTYPRTYSGPPIQDIYPMAKSPTMSIHTSDGTLSSQIFQDPNHPGVLTEARLILNFLSQTFAGDLWRVTDPQDQRQDEFIQEFANNTLESKLAFCSLFEALLAQLPLGIRHLVSLMVRPILNMFKRDVKKACTILEAMLTAERPWFAGKQMGLADFIASWCFDTIMQRGYLDRETFPNIHRWHETITARDAYKRAREKGGKYNLVTFQ